MTMPHKRRNTHTYIHTYICTYVCMYVRMYVHIYIYIYTYVCVYVWGGKVWITRNKQFIKHVVYMHQQRNHDWESTTYLK